MRLSRLSTRTRLQAAYAAQVCHTPGGVPAEISG
jgi:hypothetical protein